MTIVRDPVCGMDVDTETALSAKIGDRTYYFCSQQCLDVYTAPERELKAMAWILKTTDDVYPEEEFLTSFDEKGHKENSEMLRELLDEYKRVYLKKR